MADFVTDKVWVPNKDEVWELGDVLSAAKDESTITVEIGSEEKGTLRQAKFKLSDTRAYDREHDQDLDNIFEMGDMNEAALLNLLKRRAQDDKIYTYIGDILLSVNPFERIKGLYEPITNKIDVQRPHVYSVAYRAYDAMQKNGLRGKSQSILINGESGAGKTEASKHIMTYLAELSQMKRLEANRSSRAAILNRRGPITGSVKLPKIFGKRSSFRRGSETSTGGPNAEKREVSAIESTIMNTNPVLEAFGNACTIRNDNSSRFGKFVQLDYNSDGVIIGAKTLHFLLEKSRVVTHGRGERGYHVFYMLCAAAQAYPERFQGLGLQHWSNYKYLSPSEGDPELASSVSASARRAADHAERHVSAQSRTERDLGEFLALLNALNILDFEEEEHKNIWRTLAGILALGNVSFESHTERKPGHAPIQMSRVDLSTPEKQANFHLVSKLLGADEESFAESFCKRTVQAGGRASVSHVPLTTKEAEASRDGLAKAIYHSLFKWLVDRLNDATKQATGTSGSASVSAVPGPARGGRRGMNSRAAPRQPVFIGILDIFGFEVLEKNSFEQLCINYANEVLQGMFDDHVFQLELESLRSENISCPALSFRDNKDLLRLLDHKGTGVFQLLDEQGALGTRGSDAQFLVAIHSAGRNNKRLIKHRRATPSFEIAHFAGQVTYDSRGLVSKNSDHLQPDLLTAIIKGIPLSTPSQDKTSRRSILSIAPTKSSRSLRSTLDRDMASAFASTFSSEKSMQESFEGPFTFLISLLASPRQEEHAPRRKTRNWPGKSKSKLDDAGDGREEKRKTRKMAKLVSVSAVFRAQMVSLQDLLESTMLHFVRCIKPNERRQHKGWDARMVATQLKMLGILEMVRVRHDGFPVRSTFKTLLQKYPELLEEQGIEWRPDPRKPSDMVDRKALVSLLTAMLGEKSKGSLWQLGETKAFMFSSALKQLDHAVRVKRDKDETTRLLIEQRRQAKLAAARRVTAATKIAAAYRGQRDRLQARKEKRAILKLQSLARMVVAMITRAQMRRAATLLAAFARGELARKQYRGIKAVVKVQSCFRGARTRVSWERLLFLRRPFQMLLRENEAVATASKATRGKTRFTSRGKPVWVVFTTGPTPRLLIVTRSHKLLEEIPWKGDTIAAMAVSENKLLIHSDAPAKTAQDLLDEAPKSRSIWSFFSRIGGSSAPSASTEKTNSDHKGEVTQPHYFLLSEGANAFQWLLSIQTPYNTMHLMALHAPFQFEPTRTENTKWVMGGDGVLGGKSKVSIQDTVEVILRRSHEDNNRFALLKETVLFWFKEKKSKSLKLQGGFTINKNMRMAKSKLHDKPTIKLSSELFGNEPVQLLFKSKTDREKWFDHTVAASTYRSNRFKRHTLTKAYVSSRRWEPHELALALDEIHRDEDDDLAEEDEDNQNN